MLFLSVRGFLDYAGPTVHSRFAWLPCCLPPTRNEVGILIYGLFAAQSPRPPMPLPTLQEHISRCPLQDSRSRWIRYFLSCRDLASPTTCRFIPALSELPVIRQGFGAKGLSTLLAALNAGVSNNPSYLATSAQVHKLTRARPLLIRVIQHQAVQTRQDILQIEVQLRVSFQSTLKVFSEGGFTSHLSVRDAQELLGNWRDQFDSFIIVADDRVQIMSIPSCNPILGQLPNLISCHVSFPSSFEFVCIER